MARSACMWLRVVTCACLGLHERRVFTFVAFVVVSLYGKIQGLCFCCMLDACLWSLRGGAVSRQDEVKNNGCMVTACHGMPSACVLHGRFSGPKVTHQNNTCTFLGRCSCCAIKRACHEQYTLSFIVSILQFNVYTSASGYRQFFPCSFLYISLCI